MSSRCLTWMVDTTPTSARNCSPSVVSTPTQRPFSTRSACTDRSHWTVPPYPFRQLTKASVSAPEPPSGIVQLRCCREQTVEYARIPEPDESGRTNVCYACQSRYDRTWRLSNSCLITSHALSIRRRFQMLPRG